MIAVPCKTDGLTEKKLLIYENIISIDNSSIPFSKIKSVHLKTENGFFLKLKLEDPTQSIILEFITLHLRDMIKNIILDRIKIAENISKNFLEKNIEYKKRVKNIKGIIKNSDLILKNIDKHEDLYLQKEMNFSPEMFYSSMNQSLINVFIKMNCSIEQFYNLLTNSYFFNIKNQKNSVDRLLAEELRGNKRDIGLTYATRVNSFSFMNLVDTEECQLDIKINKPKDIEFKPEYSLSTEMNKPLEKEEGILKYVDFEMDELSAEIKVKTQENVVVIPFEQSDFEAARDLCKIAYENKTVELKDEILGFSENLRNMIEGKYGKEALKYVERLIPSFYLSNNF